jgi:hypothetical protein
MRPQFCLHSSSAHQRLALYCVLPLLFATALHAQYANPSPYGSQYSSAPQYPQQQQPYPPQQYGAQNYAQAPPDQFADQGAPQPGYAPPQPLSADQLEQMVAPIALYPDALVAQILAAATYPAQVVGADHWLQAQGYASADQVAYGADQQTWDPSVKALTAFPQVLAQMDHDIQWTTDLGNAYYNQPQDVLQTIQVMRQRAENAGTLQSTPQEEVTNNAGYIQLAPVNPQVVYVPAYSPWDVYGKPVQPYPGFSLLGSLESFAGSAPVRFGLGIAMSAFSHTPFGWAGWALNWLTQNILFHQSNYTSQSTTVAHWNNYPHGGLPSRTPRGLDASVRGGYNGSPRPATEFARSQAFDHSNRPSPGQSFARPPVRGENFNDNRGYSAYRGGEAPNRGYPPQGNYVRPAMPGNLAYNRPSAPMTAREQANGGYGGYQPGRQGGYGQAFSGRPSAPYTAPQRNEFAQRSYSNERSYAGYGGSAYGNRAFAEARPEKSGGSHFFGGGHSSDKSFGGYKAPKNSFKAPKAPKEHSHGGGGHSGGEHGGHHR